MNDDGGLYFCGLCFEEYRGLVNLKGWLVVGSRGRRGGGRGWLDGFNAMMTQGVSEEAFLF